VAAAAQPLLRTEHQSTNQQTWGSAAAILYTPAVNRHYRHGGGGGGSGPLSHRASINQSVDMGVWQLLLSPAYAHIIDQPISRHGGVAAAAQPRLRTEQLSTNQQTWGCGSCCSAPPTHRASINQSSDMEVWQLLLSPAYAHSIDQPISRHGGCGSCCSLAYTPAINHHYRHEWGGGGCGSCCLDMRVWQLLLSPACINHGIGGSTCLLF
jgi:hypothetical protein